MPWEVVNNLCRLNFFLQIAECFPKNLSADDEMLDKLISVLEFVNPKEKVQWFQCSKCNDVGIHFFAHTCLHIICERCYTDKQICPVCKYPSGIGMTKVTQMEDVKKVNVFCPLKTSDCQAMSSILNIVEHVKSSHSEKMEALLLKPDNFKTVPIIEKISHKDTEEMAQLRKDMKESLAIANREISKLQKQVGILEHTVENERKERLKLQNEIQYLNTSESGNSQHGARFATGEQDLKYPHFNQPEYDEQNLRNELRINTQSTQMESTCYTWKLYDFVQILHDLKNHKYGEYSSPIFTTRDYNFKLRVNLCFHSPYEYVSIFMGFITEDGAADRPAPSIYYHQRTVSLQDQSGQARQRDITRVYAPGFGKKDAEMWMKGFYGWWMFARVKLLLGNSHYVKDGTVVVKILIEPLVSVYRNFSSNVGVLFWKIENYRESKEDEIDEVVDFLGSDYFYSSRTGYRMQVRAHLNGWKEGKGTYMALFLWFQKGQFDDTLAEKIHYRLTCTMLDQTISFVKNDLVRATTRIDDRLDVGYGFPDFALQATVEQAIYLRNNTLNIKIFVEIL